MIKIALCVMVKNEEAVLRKTVESCRDAVDVMYVFDTGSDDATLDIARELGCKLLQGEFVDYATSRNAMLDWVENDDKSLTHLLLLDANDELRGGSRLRQLLEIPHLIESAEKCGGGFYIRQQWFYGNTSDRFFNIRLIKAHMQWRYKGSVHEFICRPPELPQSSIKIDVKDVEIYQDRTQNCESSIKRFAKDREILLRDFQKDPSDTRTVFYLAQTCKTLGLHSEAYYYYTLRLEYEGFCEERFHSMVMLGELAAALRMDPWVSLMWWFQAASHSIRAEPLCNIAHHFIFRCTPPIYTLAYAMTHLACSLDLPNGTLFVDKNAYDYKRWHLNGIACYYLKHFEEGKESCEKAIEACDKDIDKYNLQFYTNKKECLSST